LDIRVQERDFDQGAEYKKLAGGHQIGAVVTFVGLVREFHSDSQLFLQHYPGMTEKVLGNIVKKAQERWQFDHACVIHRIGSLKPGDQIVFVGVSSKHRKQAFQASMFIMDYLKTRAPFWKKEGDHWVDAKSSDMVEANKWLNDENNLDRTDSVS